jgi:sulfite reductase beta subunit-like hemoprotein
LRTIAAARSINFIVTAQQDIVLTGITQQDKGFIDETLAAHGVRPVDALGLVERSALACPALPTCGQALAESERVLPNAVAQLEGSLASAGPRGKRLQLRMTGCPNGCARPAVAEVGIVGRTKNSYDLYLGGGLRGDRLAGLYQEKVKLDDLPSVLEPLLARWRDEGDEEESFGDFVTRVGIA